MNTTENNPFGFPAGAPVEVAAHAYAGHSEYITHSADYIVARTITIDSVTREAAIFGPTRVDESASHEIIAWRVDGIVGTPEDNTYDYALRTRLMVTPHQKGQEPPADLLIPDPLPLHAHMPADQRKAAKKASKDGMYIHTIESLHIPLEDSTASGFVRSDSARLVHNDQVYGANPRNPQAERAVFPQLPEYTSITQAAYTEHCAQAGNNLPEGVVLARELDTARRTDLKHTDIFPVTNLTAYNKALTTATPGTAERIKQLSTALYNAEANPTDSGLTTELVTILLDQHTVEAAGIALLNKWSYVQRVEGKGYSHSLTAQLKTIVEHGSTYQAALNHALHNILGAYDELLAAGLEDVAAIVRKAQTFAGYLSGLKTLSLQPGSGWYIHPR